MLYHLFNWLHSEGINFAGSRLMGYISFRVVCCALVSIVTALWAGKRIIRRLKAKQIGEEIRDLGLEGQLSKKGTPTMGGMIIALAILVPILLFGDLTNLNNILLIITTAWLGFIGYLDDRAKIKKHNKDGLSGKKKIIAQVILGLVVGLTLCFSSQLGFRVGGSASNTHEQEKVHSVVVENNAKTTIPFVKNNEFDYSWLSPLKGKAGQWWTWILYILVIIFIITACSNGANLTDGMDGLSAGVAAIVGTTLGILAYLSGHVVYADYLNIMYIPASGEIAVYMAALVGALLGFLWYNSFPAKVFMGDTGSLMLGGVIGVCAVLIRKELLLPILCGVYLAESLSVIMQTAYFKYTKKKYGAGRRIFRMSPLHHHFQKENPDALLQKPSEIQPEARIVSRFWIVSIILAVLTIVTLKIR